MSFGLLRPHLHASTTATTRRHLGRHRFRWNHHTPYFPFHPTTASIRRRARRNHPQKVAVWTDFCQTFGLSFSLISPPNWTSKVLRPRIRSRRDPLRVRQCGTTSSSRLSSAARPDRVLTSLEPS
ncbi:hypothetical protein L3X38_026707 [Prunus dulcis]|uniref:ZWICHEL kinesin-like calmodulin-binding protein n=1 Tax=Prunus dulcis TaxID=3755 RepID=A0AAD4VMG4_PRUDU|nr:hypothetical protein L3X38_026707 [Prunus dulcis]